MRKYIDAVAGVSPTVLGASRAADIVAALAPPLASGGKSSALVVSAPQESLGKKFIRFTPDVAGLGAGFLLWPNHRILGALAGHAVAVAGYEYYKGDKKRALCQLAVEGGAVAGALYCKNHRAWGFIGGAIGGAIVTYFVPGSPSKALVARLRGK